MAESSPETTPAPLGELRDETWRAKNRPDNLFGSAVVEEGMRCFVLMREGGSGPAGGVPPSGEHSVLPSPAGTAKGSAEGAEQAGEPAGAERKGGAAPSRESSGKASLRVGLREVTMNHALMQIVREMVMNCTDLVERDPEFRKIAVTIDGASGCITIRNDGRGIPVGKDLIAIADETRRAALQDLWSPTLLLARWGCSSNYDDSKVRFTAGKNGLGAKAVLAWCSRVEVRAVDSVRKRSFSQTWTDGMRQEGRAVVKEGVARRGFTEIRMWPDYAALVRMPLPLSEDQVGALRWCVWECSTVLPRGDRFGVSVDGVTLPDHSAEGMMRAALSLCASVPAGEAKAATLPALLRTLAPLVPRKMAATAEGEGDDAASVASRAADPGSPPPLLRAHVTWAPHGEALTGFAFPTHALAPGLAALLPPLGFVNGVPCPKGTHRQRWESALATDLNKKLGAKVTLSRGPLLGSMVVAACARINQPRFGSQTKDELVTRLPAAATLAGAVPVGPLARAGFFAYLKAQHAAREEADAVRTVAANLLAAPAGASSAPAASRRRYDVDDVEHYEGAELAGRARQCFLFLTEGLSAQNCARNVIARLPSALKRVCGSFALRGKLINAMSHPTAKVLANKEVQGLVRICNLNPALSYETAAERATLRYAKLVLWTDADTDGGHIAWLVFLLVHKFWPALAAGGFVERFVTPLLKVLDPKQPMQFYSEAARDRWLERAAEQAGLGGTSERSEGAAAGPSPAAEDEEEDAEAVDQPGLASLSLELATPDMRRRALDAAVSARGVKVKYFKGLGRLMSEDEKDLAARFEDLRIRLEVAAGEERVIEALGADDADARREIQLAREIRALPYDDVDRVTITEFIDGELLPYMRDANLRQVPGVDGFVEVSRMILSYFFAVPSAAASSAEHGVARLAAAIAARMDYHHGEASMAGAIATMAQSFAGKNNVNLLQPRGQFGERSEPTPGQPRYTNTALEPYTRALFPPEDYPALPMPRHGEVPAVLPGVLPMILVNGATGIGYGHSTEIPSHDPRRVAALCRAWMEAHAKTLLAAPVPLTDVAAVDVPMDPAFAQACGDLLPWVRGLGRQPERTEEGGIESRGAAALSPDLRTLVVSELPAGVWTKNARASLAKLPWLAGVYMHPRIASVHITAEVTDPTRLPAAVREEAARGVLDGPELLRALKLSRRVGYGNMKAFDRTGRLRAFPSVAALLHDFALLRIWVYARRRSIELHQLARDSATFRGRLRFIELQLDGALDLRAFPDRAAVYAHLAARHAAEVPAVEGAGSGGRGYLDATPVWNLTRAEVERLRARYEATEAERHALEAMTAADMWLRDLDAAEAALGALWRSGPPAEGEEQEVQPVQMRGGAKAKGKAASIFGRGKGSASSRKRVRA
jgi:DNA gyrase/topoisomerase IV subunit B